MICKKCGYELSDDYSFCPMCGRAVVKKHVKKQRGNGQGSVYTLPNGKYKAVYITGYYTKPDGTRGRKMKTKTFSKKTDAVKALTKLAESESAEKKNITFKDLYDKWLPTHRAGKSTLDCYKAAVKHFEPVWGMTMADIDIDDLQDCLDSCGKGKRTQQNMKATCGLMYKYGIPRKYIPDNLNLAPFLIVGGEGAASRESFTNKQIEAIKNTIGKVYGAEQVYMLIYLGFRPSEFLALDISQYDKTNKYFRAGAKTEAGKNRVVTISPKIQKYVDEAVSPSEGPVIRTKDGSRYKLKDWTESVFYAVLEGAGIPNPMVEIAGGVMRHKYTPHSCRHTFATLMKNIEASGKDKQELIGHTSEEMLRYYQDVRVEDLKKITDLI